MSFQNFYGLAPGQLQPLRLATNPEDRYRAVRGWHETWDRSSFDPSSRQVACVARRDLGIPPEPDAPVPGGAAIEVPEASANDEDRPDEDSGTVERLEEGARLAKMQAAARAKARDKAAKDKVSKATAPEATTLAGDILDGPVRRGPGRPPGAKNKPKPDNDDGPPPDTDVA